MTKEEFYDVLMKDVDYIFKGGFVVNTGAFVQTMSYASEQYGAIQQRNAELEQKVKELETPKTCKGCNNKDEDGFCSLVTRVYTFDKNDIILAYVESYDSYSCVHYEPKDK